MCAAKKILASFIRLLQLFHRGPALLCCRKLLFSSSSFADGNLKIIFSGFLHNQE